MVALEQKSRRRIAVPAITVSQRGDQFGRCGLSQPGKRFLLETGSRDAVDSSAVAAARQVEVFLDDRWQACRMLDDFALHVDDVQIAVRSIGELGRSEPDGVRTDELVSVV